MQAEETTRRLQQAAAAIQSGRIDAAERLLEPLRSGAADNPDVWQLSGTVRMRRGLPAEAAEAYLRVTELAPDFVPGWVNLFRARETLSDFRGAREALDRAGAIAPNELNLLHARADFLYRHGQYDEALAAVARMQELGADDAGLLSLKAAVLQDSGQLGEAEAAVRAALERAPGTAPLELQLGRILEAEGVLDEALDRYRRTNELAPDHPDGHLGRATTLAALGRYDEAIEALGRVLELAPENLQAHYLLGSYLETNHRLEEAEETLARGLALAPDHPHLRFALARSTGRRGDYADALRELDAIAADVPPRELQIALYAERGRLRDRLGHIEPAMGDFALGNQMAAEMWRQRHTEPNPVRARLERVGDWLAAHERVPWTDPGSPESPPLAFLLGFPRTGTTLLGRLLDAHPDCEVLDEFPTVGHLAGIVDQKLGGYPEALPELDPAAIDRLAKTYHKHMRRWRRGQARLLVDKLPMNTQYLPLIRRVFPRAPIVYATRHPLAACLSCFMQPFELNPAMANFFTLADSAVIYRLTDRIRRHDLRLWLDAAAREVRYESVVTDLETTARDLLEFLGLDWTAQVLEFAAHARAAGNIRTPSYAQVSEGLYRDALDRWRRYQPYLEQIEVELEKEIRAYEGG